ncbi:U-scoloptoxin(19)-Tl1a-like [Daphnia pulex]|uniref:U-scoloptoxin(19)-Tl1a-like n=1 Tax=Daphnia pulex TaxID=6669 RepID=UPI001EDF6D7C|nr:U-scoloptoxin(19)-Tl1a-like [Daphnia pulex]
MALPLTLVFVSALLIFKAGAFPPIDNEAAVVVERSNLTSATTDLCLREGGLCVIKSQCPQDKLASKKGLCGKADKECCHSLPDTIVDCQERGGMCRLSSECRGASRDELGRCDAGHVCCILIR